MKVRQFSFLSLCLLLLAGCNLPASKASNGPQSWIDKPLNGSVLPLAPVEILTHASDTGGISRIELSVNGSVVAVVTLLNSSDTLVNVTQAWNPSQPGNYLLLVRAQNNAGVWGSFTLATITIRGVITETSIPKADTTTPTIEASLTPTVFNTSTATSTPTPSPSPTSTPTGDINILRVSSKLISIEGGACGPQESTILVNATHPGGIKVVVIFYRLKGQTSGHKTEWRSKSMTPQGSDQYSASISLSELMPDASTLGIESGTEEAWLQYMAVIQTINGDTTTRSDVYTDIVVTVCP